MSASDVISSAYYAPGGYQGSAVKLRDAIRKRFASEGKSAAVVPSVSAVQKWLSEQRLFQSHKQPDTVKADTRPSHFTGLKMNDLHVMDLMTMPNDGGYKYILTLVDAATRYKVALPLTEKSAAVVAAAVETIYESKDSVLSWPKTLNVDSGTEFKAEVTRLYERHGTRIRRSEPGNHRAQGFVEAFNKVLAQRLFRSMEARELTEEKVNREWVSELPQFVKALNAEKTQMLGMSPDRAVAEAKKGVFVQPKIPSTTQTPTKENDLLPDGEYRIATVRDRPAEGGPRRRATDALWSTKTYTISHVDYDPKGVLPTLYYMRDGPRHGLRRQELQLVKSKGSLPPSGAVSAPPQPAPVPAPAPPKPVKKTKRYAAVAAKNVREMLSGVPVHVTRSGRVVRQA